MRRLSAVFDCPPRFDCDTQAFTCVSALCPGVTCQMNSTCNPATGRQKRRTAVPAARVPQTARPWRWGAMKRGTFYQMAPAISIRWFWGCFPDGMYCRRVRPSGQTRTVCTCNNSVPNHGSRLSAGLACNQLPPGLPPAPRIDLSRCVERVCSSAVFSPPPVGRDVS